LSKRENTGSDFKSLKSKEGEGGRDWLESIRRRGGQLEPPYKKTLLLLFRPGGGKLASKIALQEKGLSWGGGQNISGKRQPESVQHPLARPTGEGSEVSLEKKEGPTEERNWDIQHNVERKKIFEVSKGSSRGQLGNSSREGILEVEEEPGTKDFGRELYR